MNFWYTIDSIDLYSKDNLAIMLRCLYLGVAEGYFTEKYIRDVEDFIADKAIA